MGEAIPENKLSYAYTSKLFFPESRNESGELIKDRLKEL